MACRLCHAWEDRGSHRGEYDSPRGKTILVQPFIWLPSPWCRDNGHWNSNLLEVAGLFSGMRQPDFTAHQESFPKCSTYILKASLFLLTAALMGKATASYVQLKEKPTEFGYCLARSILCFQNYVSVLLIRFMRMNCPHFWHMYWIFTKTTTITYAICSRQTFSSRDHILLVKLNIYLSPFYGW